jgi:hypothetical protein
LRREEKKRKKQGEADHDEIRKKQEMGERRDDKTKMLQVDFDAADFGQR